MISLDDSPVICKSPAIQTLAASLCASGRYACPDLLNDLPTAVWLPFEDDDVAAFGSDAGASGDGSEGFLKVAAVVGEIAGCFEVLAVQGEVAVEGRHHGLEERAEGGGPGDAFACGLEEDGVWSIELQDGFELLSAKVLDPGFTDSGESHDSRGLGAGSGRGRKCRGEHASEGHEGNGGPA
jgi:hypothetical protein